jgi:parallel beta-helix repeat protein
VDSHGPGATLCISGVHDINTGIVPKSRDVLKGEGVGATIDGGNRASVAIDGNGNNVEGVTVENLTIQHISNASQEAAVGRNQGPGWTIRDNTVAHNATEGIEAGPGSTVDGNNVYDNGELGITGYLSRGAVITGNQVWNNNVGCRFDPTFEAGGIKIYSKGVAASVTISGNYVHDNCGPGIWTDTDVSGGRISSNTVANETSSDGGNGIEVELSCGLTVSDNKVTGSAAAGIMVSTSHNIDVTGNVVSGPKYGIRIWAANRSGDAGPVCGNTTNNNTVSGNSITVGSDVSGLYVYTGAAPSGNTFANNTYHGSHCKAALWQWFTSSNQNLSFSSWQRASEDVHGSCN